MILKVFNILIFGISFNFATIYAKTYSEDIDYLNIIYNIKNQSKSKLCKSTIDQYIDCFINYHYDTLPDYNTSCDNYMNDKCKTLFNSTENNLLNCESTYRNQLTNVINNAYDISRLFCFKGKNNEFCPISKIFQKAKTVGESVTGDSFYSFSLLHNYCLDDVCAQYIDESFIGIYALYNIGLISEENIMSSLKYIRDFIESPDCNKIRKNYGHVETMIDVNSETSINESSSSKNIIFSWNLLFTIMIIIIHINFIS